MTRKELACKFLEGRGYRYSKTIAHYDIWANATKPSTLYFLGRNGAVRVGSNVTGSVSRTSQFERCIYGVDQG